MREIVKGLIQLIYLSNSKAPFPLKTRVDTGIFESKTTLNLSAFSPFPLDQNQWDAGKLHLLRLLDTFDCTTANSCETKVSLR